MILDTIKIHFPDFCDKHKLQLGISLIRIFLRNYCPNLLNIWWFYSPTVQILKKNSLDDDLFKNVYYTSSGNEITTEARERSMCKIAKCV